MKKSDLVRVTGADVGMKKLVGKIGRVVRIEREKIFVLIDSVMQAFGTAMFFLRAENLEVIIGADGKLQGWLKLADWQDLSGPEKANILTNLVRNHREYDWYENFEHYIVQPDTISLLDVFIQLTIAHKRTHNHYGAKAIFEELRWHSMRKDSCAIFKVNNNYAADIARVVILLFPAETQDFFSIRKRALAVA